MNKQAILDFIKKHTICVIATVTENNKSESAVIEFGENEKLELIFDTLNTSRKYKNLQTNKNVSVVIGWDENITIQYEGEASELTGKEKESYKQLYFKKNPRAKRWENREGIVYFKIKPTWIRYSDLNSYPWKISEINI